MLESFRETVKQSWGLESQVLILGRAKLQNSVEKLIKLEESECETRGILSRKVRKEDMIGQQKWLHCQVDPQPHQSEDQLILNKLK